MAAALSAFLSDPQPFLDGAADITKTTVENIAKPIASVPAVFASEAAKVTNWTIVAIVLIVTLGAVVGVKAWLRSRAIRLLTSAHSPCNREK